MARIIKFRAWDSNNKKWIETIPVVESRIDSDVWDHHDDDDGASFTPNYAFFHYSFNGRIIFQQFTGLLDINGKEIYEGDIVEFISRSDINGLHSQTKRIMDVQFNNGMFYPIPTETAVGDNRYWICKQDYKIIGNIFENPELIEKK